MAGEGALAASLFTGFPHADIANAGLSAVVVTDGDVDAFGDQPPDQRRLFDVRTGHGFATRAHDARAFA